MRHFLLQFSICFIFLSTVSCQNETDNTQNIENKGSIKKSISIEQNSPENLMIGTFKFDFSHGRTEVIYHITFDSKLQQAKVKILFHDIVINHDATSEKNKENVEHSVEEFTDNKVGKLNILSDSENSLKCKLELTPDDTYIMFYDKKQNKWYIDVKSTIYQDVMSKEKVYGERIQ